MQKGYGTNTIKMLNKCYLHLFAISQILSFIEMGLYGLSIILGIQFVTTVYDRNPRIPYSLTFTLTITILATFLEFIGFVIKSKCLLISLIFLNVLSKSYEFDSTSVCNEPGIFQNVFEVILVPKQASNVF